MTTQQRSVILEATIAGEKRDGNRAHRLVTVDLADRAAHLSGAKTGSGLVDAIRATIKDARRDFIDPVLTVDSVVEIVHTRRNPQHGQSAALMRRIPVGRFPSLADHVSAYEEDNPLLWDDPAERESWLAQNPDMAAELRREAEDQPW